MKDDIQNGEVERSIMLSHINTWLGVVLLLAIVLGIGVYAWKIIVGINPIAEAIASQQQF